jgi:hypothetical protein
MAACVIEKRSSVKKSEMAKSNNRKRKHQYRKSAAKIEEISVIWRNGECVAKAAKMAANGENGEKHRAGCSGIRRKAAKK